MFFLHIFYDKSTLFTFKKNYSSFYAIKRTNHILYFKETKQINSVEMSQFIYYMAYFRKKEKEDNY